MAGLTLIRYVSNVRGEEKSYADSEHELFPSLLKGFDMTRRRKIHSQSIGVIAALLLFSSETPAQDAKVGHRAEVTLKGNVLCNRATDTKPWFWDPKDGDHTP